MEDRYMETSKEFRARMHARKQREEKKTSEYRKTLIEKYGEENVK